MVNDVIGASASTSLGAGKAAEAAKSESATSIASDFETFLTLLTTQMRNQDPLKPLESTEFVAQLATFSSVEQQVATNDKLARIETRLAGGAADLAGWLGARVLAPMPLQWDGGPVPYEMDPASGADKQVLVVRDAAGVTVQRVALETDAVDGVWDGAGAQEGGVYSLAVERWDGDELLQTDEVRVIAEPNEVRPGEEGVELIFPGGVKLAQADVAAILAPQP